MKISDILNYSCANHIENHFSDASNMAGLREIPHGPAQDISDAACIWSCTARITHHSTSSDMAPLPCLCQESFRPRDRGSSFPPLLEGIFYISYSAPRQAKYMKLKTMKKKKKHHWCQCYSLHSVSLHTLRSVPIIWKLKMKFLKNGLI